MSSWKKCKYLLHCSQHVIYYHKKEHAKQRRHKKQVGTQSAGVRGAEKYMSWKTNKWILHLCWPCSSRLLRYCTKNNMGILCIMWLSWVQERVFALAEELKNWLHSLLSYFILARSIFSHLLARPPPDHVRHTTATTTRVVVGNVLTLSTQNSLSHFFSVSWLRFLHFNFNCCWLAFTWSYTLWHFIFCQHKHENKKKMVNWKNICKKVFCMLLSRVQAMSCQLIISLSVVVSLLWLCFLAIFAVSLNYATESLFNFISSTATLCAQLFFFSTYMLWIKHGRRQGVDQSKCLLVWRLKAASGARESTKERKPCAELESLNTFSAVLYAHLSDHLCHDKCNKKKKLYSGKSRVLSRKPNCPAESIESNYFIKIAGGGRSLFTRRLSLTLTHIYISNCALLLALWKPKPEQKRQNHT